MTLEVTEPACHEFIETGECDDLTHSHEVSDSTMPEPDDTFGPGTAYLPHSCDKWVIGGPDQIRALIEDLESALEKIKGDS